jgi:environmental stress-induced protein Ves
MPVTPLSRVIPANDYRRERWRNGAGWTRAICRVPERDEWDWRLSIAEIERNAPFSTFPGIDRELVLLGGNGLRLRFDDGETRQLDPPYGRVRFAGERALTGGPVDGRSEDFNLMWRRDAVTTQLWHRPLVGPMVVFVDPGSTWVVHLLAGDARFAADTDLPPLAMGDTALLVAGDTRRRYGLEGAGEALLIRIDPAA